MRSRLIIVTVIVATAVLEVGATASGKDKAPESVSFARWSCSRRDLRTWVGARAESNSGWSDARPPRSAMASTLTPTR